MFQTTTVVSFKSLQIEFTYCLFVNYAYLIVSRLYEMYRPLFLLKVAVKIKVATKSGKNYSFF